MKPESDKKIHIRLFGLRTRFILLITLILMAIFGLIAFFLVNNAHNTLTKDLNNEVKAFAALSVQPIGNTFITYQNSGSLLIQQQMQKFTSLDPNISNVAIVGLDGKSQFTLNNQGLSVSAADASKFTATNQVNSRGEIERVIEPYIDDSGVHSYAVVYYVSTKSLDRTIAHEEYLILIFTVIGLVISAVATYIFLNILFIRPVEDVTDSAQIIAAGKYDQQIASKRHDEIGVLAGSVNHMADALKADISKLQEVDRLKSEFITITSHNLRTPLTIIRGNVENLHSTALPKEIARPLHDIEASSNDLASFAEDMLTISSIEAGQTFVDREPISIESLTKPLRENFATIAADKDVKLVWEIPMPEAMVNVSVNYTRGAIRSLLDNAIKFTGKDGSVICRVSVENQALHIIVKDTGIGISPAEQAKLFTKFHRGTSTLEYNYAGTGIGLYVTKLMVEAQHGTIQVASETGKGSTFTVAIPQ